MYVYISVYNHNYHIIFSMYKCEVNLKNWNSDALPNTLAILLRFLLLSLKGVPSCKTANIIFIVYTANKNFFDCVFVCMYIHV